ncbi:MAG TPA: class I SAM-dependent methyltransferase [Albitalea sp.]|nr:class I SAM-dependent methyltransferase [Albitalea sp.]
MLYQPPNSFLRWPMPALLAWGASWAVFLAASRWLKLAPLVSMLPAAALAITFSLRGNTRWRRVFIAWGFPLSLGVSGLIGDLPAWVWLLPLALLAIVYPVRTWRDAPLFPTPADALVGLARRLPLGPGARVLDAGCGLGDALIALHREYPRAAFTGLEWSWPLRLACARRAPFAQVKRADIWAADWSGFDLVYLFQRPDNVARAAAKAGRELRPGAWLASLEFAVPDLVPSDTLQCPDGRRVWLYQAPFRR